MRLSVNAFSNTVWQIQFTSRLFLSSFFFRQISKKHLNERQILAIQYISRGAYPSFANFCNRGEDYSLWAGKGSFSYQISLQDFEECENHFPMCKKPKERKERNRSYFYNVPSVSAFLVENHCFAIGLLQLDDNAIGDSSSTMFFSCCI